MVSTLNIFHYIQVIHFLEKSLPASTKRLSRLPVMWFLLALKIADRGVFIDYKDNGINVNVYAARMGCEACLQLRDTSCIQIF